MNDEAEREAALAEFERGLADFHRNNFVGRIIAPRIPETFFEGLAKGLVIGGLITSMLLNRNFINFDPATAHKVYRFYASIALAVGGMGLLNDYQNNFRREGRRIGFFEGFPPATRNEGLSKGFVVGFTLMALLRFGQVGNFTNIAGIISVCSAMLLGALWGSQNERRARR